MCVSARRKRWFAVPEDPEEEGCDAGVMGVTEEEGCVWLFDCKGAQMQSMQYSMRGIGSCVANASIC